MKNNIKIVIINSNNNYIYNNSLHKSKIHQIGMLHTVNIAYNGY